MADGYHNTRVVKFDKGGKYLTEWGAKGNGPGQFNLIHDVTIDAQHRIYVADRGNNRVQVFREDGTFLDQWPNIHNPSHFWITKDGYLWLVSGDGNRLAKFDLSGKLITYWACMAGLLGGSMIRIRLMSTLQAISMSRKSLTTASKNLSPAKMPTSRVSLDRSSSLKVGSIRMTGLARWRCPAYPISLSLGGGDLIAYPLSGSGRESNYGVFFRVPEA